MRLKLMRVLFGGVLLFASTSTTLASQHSQAGTALLLMLVASALIVGLIIGITWQRRQTQKKTQRIEHRAKKLEQEVLEQSSSKEQLHQLAYYDEITSLPNRLLFNERLHGSLIDDRGIVGVAIVDLDRFKNFNDMLGHEAGNALLRLVSKRIASSLPRGTLLARYGGDEFAILISHTRPEECMLIAERILHSLKDPITELGTELYVTASIGVSHYPSEASNISELLQQADIAMYRAKEEGGNANCLYDTAIGSNVMRRIEVETGLRRALVNGEMWIEYQPQVDLISGKVHAAEALLRWRHPERGLMNTYEFIKVAEETGQIVSIGEWVLEEVCAQASQWREQGSGNFKIGVNLSSKQVEKKGFVQFVKQLIDEYDFPPESMELEITEHVLIDRERETQKTMGALKDLGMSLAIDDFGTGYSALSYLHRFPIDTLKIDKSFVANLQNDENNKTITGAIVAMADRLNLRTVAECVENPEQIEILSEMQCQAAQGYFFTKPLTQEEVVRWMRKAA